MSDQPKKKCFVISPIGDPAGSVRAEADWVLKGLIRSALEPEFTVARADAYPKNDVITNQVILAIKNADLVVADLTGHNPNVFYELAVAHAFERPVVPMIRAGESIPFDNHLMGTIFYSRERFELFEQAKADLKQAAAEAVKAGHKISNPITMALGVGQMRASGDDRDQVIAELVESVALLKADRAGRTSLPSMHSVPERTLFTPTHANAEILLQRLYGNDFRDLSPEDMKTAIQTVIVEVTREEREVKRNLTWSEAMRAIKRANDDITSLTIPF
jgi:hypothetical protein